MKSKIIGVVLLIFTSFFIISYFYSVLVTHTGNAISNIIFNIMILSISVIVGMELVSIKKEGIYNKLLQICGILLIVLYMIWLILIAFRISLW